MQYRHIRLTRLVVAISIVVILMVTGWSYWRHARRLNANKQSIPDILPKNVENATVGFNYTKIEAGQVVYSIKAWRNLGLKGNKNILEDVEVLVYGKGGDRYDRIHSARADYDQDTGTVQFEGEVTLLLSSKSQEQRAKNLAASDPRMALLNKTQVTTSKIVYSQRTNQVDTPAPVEFTFNDLSGSAVGMHYDATADHLQLERNVRVRMDRGQGAAPVEITSGALDFMKSTRQVTFSAPVELHRGDDSLSAQKMTIFLDADNRIERAQAEGNPVVQAITPTMHMNLTAGSLTANLRDQGKFLDSIVAENNVHATSQSGTTITEMTAQRLTAGFAGPRNDLQQLTGENNVVLKIQPGPTAVAATITPANATAGFSLSNSDEEKILYSNRVEITMQPGGKEFQRLTCPVAGALELIPPIPTQDLKTIRGDRFDAAFSGTRNALDSFRATGHVTVDLEPQTPQPASTHRKTSSHLLVARFDSATGLLAQIDQSGSFHYVETALGAQSGAQAGEVLRQATASNARYTAADKKTLLEGRPRVWDSSGRTTARTLSVDESSDTVTATGAVLTVYQEKKNPVGPFGDSNSPVFISADRLVGHSRRKTAVYSGNARMWQDDDVVKADEIDLDQNLRTMVASGRVMSTFLVEESGKNKKDFMAVKAEDLKYDDNLHRARYEKNVVMQGDLGTLEAPLLDIFLVAKPQPHESRIDRAVAQGGVTILQPQRRAHSERALFMARENKVILTGDHPTIVDATKGASTGRELTFFTRDDRILIDGDAQARATTQHKVARQ